MTHSIYHNLLIKSPLEKVYEAVTNPVHLINWWPLKCTGNPLEGETYNFYFTPEYDWYGQVIKAEKNRSFHIKMIKSDEDWDPTSFGFDLEDLKDAVQIKFWHVGWPKCNEHFKRSSFCWAILLNGLKNYLEQGVIVPFDQRE